MEFKDALQNPSLLSATAINAFRVLHSLASTSMSSGTVFHASATP